MLTSPNPVRLTAWPELAASETPAASAERTASVEAEFASATYFAACCITFVVAPVATAAKTTVLASTTTESTGREASNSDFVFAESIAEFTAIGVAIERTETVAVEVLFTVYSRTIAFK